MVIGCIFQELLQKVLCGFEVGSYGFELFLDDKVDDYLDQVCYLLKMFGLECVWVIGDVFCIGLMVDEINEYIGIDFWFLV